MYHLVCGWGWDSKHNALGQSGVKSLGLRLISLSPHTNSLLPLKFSHLYSDLSTPSVAHLHTIFYFCSSLCYPDPFCKS